MTAEEQGGESPGTTGLENPTRRLHTEQREHFTGEANTGSDHDEDALSRDPVYLECQENGCGSAVPEDQLDYHHELHRLEEGKDDPASAAEVEVDRRLTRRRRRSVSFKRPESADGTRAHDAGQHDSAGGDHQGGQTSADGNVGDRQGSAPDASPGASRGPRREERKRQRGEAESTGATTPARPPPSSLMSRLLRSLKILKTDDGQTETVVSSGPKRLGKAQLGRFAHEEQMPESLRLRLLAEGQVVGQGVLRVLDELLDRSEETLAAYLCHPCVQHVTKLRGEGGFCGYRNIQMMSSYIIGTKYQGHDRFPGGEIPTIFEIQDFIEEAWDNNINAQGRIETGGVRGTRKYIGTPEALAMFNFLGIPCNAAGFKDTEPGKAEQALLGWVEKYFASAEQSNVAGKVTHCRMAPIYFQHKGHSLTIVGYEKLKGGRPGNLLVFDPMFLDPPGVRNFLGRAAETPRHVLEDSNSLVHTLIYHGGGGGGTALKAYRRGHRYLRRFKQFEVMSLVGTERAETAGQTAYAPDEQWDYRDVDDALPA